jgi:hypothetical protein
VTLSLAPPGPLSKTITNSDQVINVVQFCASAALQLVGDTDLKTATGNNPQNYSKMKCHHYYYYICDKMQTNDDAA